MRTNVASAIGIGFGIGLGLALGGALVSVAPALAGQSTPAPPAPTLAPPAPSFRPAVTGANIPEKVLLYTRSGTTAAVPGGIVNVSATCDSPADTIVTGACNASNYAMAHVWGSQVLDVSDSSRKTEYRCSFTNGGRSNVPVEAQIVCRRPR